MVVARAPDDRAEVGRTAWLAPYLSSARGAAVVLTHAQGAAVAEADVRQLIRRESLQPRTVTILADYASIGYRHTQARPGRRGRGPATSRPRCHCRSRRYPLEPLLPAELLRSPAEPPPLAGAAAAPPPHYTVRTEPFVPTQPDQLATLGVGRIPLESLGDASVFFVRGLLRERLFAPSSAAGADGCELRRRAAGLAAVRDDQSA